MLRITVLFVAVSLTATAQIPMSGPIGECSVDAVEDDGNDNVAQSEFVIPPDVVISISPGTLCSFYAIAGWESPLKLHLGEGASEYRELIERAVEVWNETVHLPSREPLIEIIETAQRTICFKARFGPTRVNMAARTWRTMRVSFTSSPLVRTKPASGDLHGVSGVVFLLQ